MQHITRRGSSALKSEFLGSNHSFPIYETSLSLSKYSNRAYFTKLFCDGKTRSGCEMKLQKHYGKKPTPGEGVSSAPLSVFLQES